MCAEDLSSSDSSHFIDSSVITDETSESGTTSGTVSCIGRRWGGQTDERPGKKKNPFYVHRLLRGVQEVEPRDVTDINSLFVLILEPHDRGSIGPLQTSTLNIRPSKGVQMIGQLYHGAHLLSTTFAPSTESLSLGSTLVTNTQRRRARVSFNTCTHQFFSSPLIVIIVGRRLVG